MTKPQILVLANAKDARMKELRKKLSKCHMSIAIVRIIDRLLTQFNRGTKGCSR